MHDIIGSGEISACGKVESEECSGCCQRGFVLLPGEDEFLKSLKKCGEVPSDVVIGIGRIFNCFDEKRRMCSLGIRKALLCKLFPEVSIFKYWQDFHLYLSRSPKCPVIITDDSGFSEQASLVKKIIQNRLGIKSYYTLPSPGKISADPLIAAPSRDNPASAEVGLEEIQFKN